MQAEGTAQAKGEGGALERRGGGGGGRGAALGREGVWHGWSGHVGREPGPGLGGSGLFESGLSS